MALKFHRLRIAKIKHETADSVSISLQVPDGLKDTFQYQPGQYLTVRVFINGQEHRRAYSLSSSPLVDEYLTVTTKRVVGGQVSNYLNDNMEEGMELEVMPPLGNFVPNLDPESEQTYILFSGGSGITPIFSILRTALIVQPHSKVYLFYGNRNHESIIFHNELKDLKDKYGDRLIITHALEEVPEEWSGYKGRIDKEQALFMLNKYAGPAHMHAEYFICGPEAMMREVQLALESKLIAKERIHIERFSSKLDDEQTVEGAAVETGADGPIVNDADSYDSSKPVIATIILDGEENEITVPEGYSILEAAIDADLDPPFACQIAACATCRAKLREGKVKMDDREALTDMEMEEGYILTCQAKAITNKLVVDYDA